MGAAISVEEPAEIPIEARRQVFEGVPSLAGVAQLVREGRARHILVAVGAGISVSAGIPDFRSPGTGLYDNLERYNLPTPESVFTLEYFRSHPAPFCDLARELLPGLYTPTRTHFFLRLLEQRGLLHRVFTQNIDGLERLAGVSPERLVEAHGSFADAHCIECGAQHGIGWWREEILGGRVPTCGESLDVPRPPSPPGEEHLEALRRELKGVGARKAEAWKAMDWSKLVDVGQSESRAKSAIQEAEQQLADAPAKLAAWEAGPKAVTCTGLVKPDIVFFGEGLPARFSYLAPRDGRSADLLIVMGTSLQVMPFAGILGRASALCPRLLINREAAGLHDQPDPPMFFGNIGFRFGDRENYRDVHVAADCDAGILELCNLLGWTEDLAALERAHASAPERSSAEAFTAVMAEKQSMQEPFEQSRAPELARGLYDAIAGAAATSAGSADVRLGREQFDAAGERVAAAGEGELLVGFEDVEGGDKSPGGVSKSDFVASAKTAFKALGAQAFEALAIRQTMALSGKTGVDGGQSLKDKVLAAFRSLDDDGDGTIDKDALSQLLRRLGGATWTDERVDALLSTTAREGARSVQIQEFIDWIFGDKGEGERVAYAESNPKPAKPTSRSTARGSAGPRQSSNPRASRAPKQTPSLPRRKAAAASSSATAASTKKAPAAAADGDAAGVARR